MANTKETLQNNIETKTKELNVLNSKILAETEQIKKDTLREQQKKLEDEIKNLKKQLDSILVDVKNKTKNLKDEIWEYCRINNISNIDEFTIKLVRQGFTVEKFGATPSTKIVEKIVEVIKEVKVEVIKEVPITMVDTELSESLKNYIGLHEQCKKELLKAVDISEALRKELEIEKNKKNKDIYGED